METSGKLTVEVFLHVSRGPGLADLPSELLAPHLIAVASGAADVEGVPLRGKSAETLGSLSVILK